MRKLRNRNLRGNLLFCGVDAATAKSHRSVMHAEPVFSREQSNRYWYTITAVAVLTVAAWGVFHLLGL